MNTTWWSEEEGRQVIRQWRRSGLSMVAFARERGLSPQRVRYWRERVEGVVTDEPPVDEREQKLVPGVVVDLRSGAGVSVLLPCGIIVEARSAGEIDPTWLANVARALEEQA